MGMCLCVLFLVCSFSIFKIQIVLKQKRFIMHNGIPALMYCPIDCKVPEKPRSGIVKLAAVGVTTYGATAHLFCNAGYEIVGDGSLRCSADGAWSSLSSCDFKGYSLYYHVMDTYYAIIFDFCFISCHITHFLEHLPILISCCQKCAINDIEL